jgi:DNA anti-recombination protein RmuC
MGKYHGPERTEDFVFIILVVDGIFAELMDGGRDL